MSTNRPFLAFLMTVALIFSGCLVTLVVFSQNYLVSLRTSGTVVYPEMTIAATPCPSRINQTTTIWGTLRDSEGTLIPQRSVSVYCSRDLVAWTLISTGTSNSSGIFAIKWTPVQSGQFHLRAVSNGIIVEREHVVADLIVALDRSGDLADVQSAIEELPSGGGTIFVKSGLYILLRGLSIIGKANVTLIGDGFNTKIVKDSGLTLRIEHVTNLTIKQLHFHHTTNDHYEDLSVNGINNGLTIESCWFTRDNGSMLNIVDLVFFSPTGTTRNLLIRNNYFQYAQIDAMAVKKVIGGTIQNNTILDAATNTVNGLGSGMTLENCSNIRIKENYIGRTGNQSMGGVNIFGNSNNIIVENNTIVNVQWGVNVGTTTNVQISNNRLYDPFSSGVRVEGASDIRINNNLIKEINFNRRVPGIYVTQSQNVSIIGNTVNKVQSGIRILYSVQLSIYQNIIDLAATSTDTEGYGIQVYQSTDTHVENNTILRSTYIGLVVTQSPSTQILNNTIVEGRLSGIRLTNSNDSIIVSNLIKNNGKDSSVSTDRDGADMVSSFNCTFESNKVFDDQQMKTQLVGLAEGGNSDFNFVIENDFRWNAATAMRISGDHTLVYGNLV